jgi:hypothetical protein
MKKEYAEILLEEMRSKFDMVLEYHVRLNRKIDTIIAELAKINRKLDEHNRLQRKKIARISSDTEIHRGYWVAER